jgi:hypothetical protein
MEKRLEIITAMAELYKEELSKTAMQMILEDTAELTDEQFIFACRQHRKNSKWFPKPAELLELGIGSEKKQSEIEALTKWEKIIRALRFYGADSLRKIKGKSGIALMQIGGVERLRQIAEKDLPWVQKEFVQRYMDACQYPMLIAGAAQDIKALPQLKSM